SSQPRLSPPVRWPGARAVAATTEMSLPTVTQRLMGATHCCVPHPYPLPYLHPERWGRPGQHGRWPMSERMSSWSAFGPIFVVELVRRALAEDIGRGDVTAEATIPAGTSASARVVAREAGVVAGLPIAELVFLLLDPAVCFDYAVRDGERVEAGATLATISG